MMRSGVRISSAPLGTGPRSAGARFSCAGPTPNRARLLRRAAAGSTHRSPDEGPRPSRAAGRFGDPLRFQTSTPTEPVGNRAAATRTVSHGVAPPFTACSRVHDRFSRVQIRFSRVSAILPDIERNRRRFHARASGYLCPGPGRTKGPVRAPAPAGHGRRTD